MLKPVSELLKKLEVHVNRPWFPLAIAGVAFIDNFVFILPIIPVLAAAVLAAPKRWFSIALGMTIGTASGATLFAALVAQYGTPFIQHLAPALLHHPMWHSGENWISVYGLWALFLVTVIPTTDHPLIALAALAKLPLWKITAVMWTGKTIKYFAFSWVVRMGRYKRTA